MTSQTSFSLSGTVTSAPGAVSPNVGLTRRRSIGKGGGPLTGPFGSPQRHGERSEAIPPYPHEIASRLRPSGLSAEAAVHFEKAVSGDPENPDFRINFGVALNNLGRLDEAIGHNRKAISLNPGLPMAHANLGFALRQTGDYLNALDAFTRALELVPDHIGAQLGLVSILSGLRSREYSPEIEKALLQAFDSPFSDYAELGPAAACQLGLKYGLSAKPAPDADAHGEKAIAEYHGRSISEDCDHALSGQP